MSKTAESMLEVSEAARAFERENTTPLDRVRAFDSAIRAAEQRGAANRQAEIVKMIEFEWYDSPTDCTVGAFVKELIRKIEEQQSCTGPN